MLWTLPAAEVITLLDKSLSPCRPSLSGAILKAAWKATFATAPVWKAPQTSSWAARSDVKRRAFFKSGRASHKFWAKRWGTSEPRVTQAHQHCVITFKAPQVGQSQVGQWSFSRQVWLKYTECFPLQFFSRNMIGCRGEGGLVGVRVETFDQSQGTSATDKFDEEIYWKLYHWCT